MVYYAVIALTMVILPVLSIASELVSNGTLAGLLGIFTKWFVFWAVGVRLVLAGVSQILRPGYTLKHILGVDEPRAYVIAQELGFANLAIGAAGLISLLLPGWSLPLAFIGGVFLGLAGYNHMRRPARNMRENVAMASDLFAAAILAAAFVLSLF
ncbi:hypothetical protein MKI84_12590 [Ancylobacter sp. A5.8]|uniref:DUF6790 family protein n=1 Tax=Ancylobacter gelatini TaxID=2919920 RepID=UPI001F4EA2EF|nr:DUF6790 family protein [Ancylobacter gelatini]MCJ8143754.1 hypothetical protein [Ancylobacter gelatini]